MKIEQNRKTILDLLLNKAALKQNIAEDTEKVFLEFKETIKTELEALRKVMKDERVRLSCKEIGKYEKHAYIGSDVLVFHLHNNVFRLPDDNPLWGTEYFKENEANGYFGIIYIYNFLAESFVQSRIHDQGYLIGRIFMNHEGHFFVEGKGQLGILFRDVENMKLTKEAVKLIVQMAFVFAIEFDLLIPPYDFVSELTVAEMQAISNNLQLQTGKRLGFKMNADDKDFF
ncbi:MAG: hypothetical protein EP305_12015 [Bacteroidetes bacterium]|nr:MAG: hypothetical protein EP305_12015 [Bacteroidota bacterium]